MSSDKNIKMLTDDKEIMLLVRDGEISKLSQLFERYHKPLYNYFSKLTYDTALSEDLTQEVFLKIIKYRRTYKGTGKFSTWMFQIAHNTFYDHVRRKKKHTSIDEKTYDLKDEDIDLHRNVTDQEDTRLIRKALMMLPDDFREALILRNYQNMKYSEIAELTGTPVGTIKARVHMAIKKLKSAYNELTQEAR